MSIPVTVLGASGMLGALVFDELSRDRALNVSGTARSPALADSLRRRGVGLGVDGEWRVLDAETASLDLLTDLLRGTSWVINAIGVIKPYIRDDNPQEVERAVRVNALFPHLLARAAEKVGAQVLQIATDCVYSGQRGRYTEADPHDALDVYGKTKSLGEAHFAHVHHLRCSIIGPEPKAHVSLLDWFLGQKPSASVGGYTNHQWNGVTTLHFAKLCGGIIGQKLALPHLQHVVPTGMVSKKDLLTAFAREYSREDVTINATEAKTVIDRTLATANPDVNARLWTAAGYSTPPTVPQMVAELAKFDFRFRQ